MSTKILLTNYHTSHAGNPNVTSYMYHVMLMVYLYAFYLRTWKAFKISVQSMGLFHKMNLSSLNPLFDYNVHNNPCMNNKYILLVPLNKPKDDSNDMSSRK